MKSVGIRELKQNASAVIRRVKAGESLEVTDRGLPVARIVPIARPDDLIERLHAEGRVVRPGGNLTEFPPPLVLPKGRPLPSQILAAMRDHER
jgi:prevent-host-death family protein